MGKLSILHVRMLHCWCKHQLSAMKTAPQYSSSYRDVCLNPATYNVFLHWSSLPVVSPHPFLSLPPIWHLVLPFHVILFFYPSSFCAVSFPSPSLSPAVGLDLKDFQNNKNRYLIASENQRPGHFSTAPLGSLTASPSSGSLSSQVGLQSVTSIQERIMSTPGGEEAIERLKVGIVIVHPKPRAVSPLESSSLHLSGSTHWRRWKTQSSVCYTKPHFHM